MQTKEFKTEEDLKKLCKEEDIQCKIDLDSILKDKSEINQEIQQKDSKTGLKDDSFYLERDKMFLFIKNPEIIEIYKKIANALIKNGSEICNDLNSVF